MQILFPIVVFAGPGGSGKSTHIDLLSQTLRSQGYKVHKTQIRDYHTFMFFVERIIAKLGYYDYHSQLCSKFNYFERIIWTALNLVDITLAVLMKVYIPRLFNYVILVERYLISSTVDLIYNMHGPSFGIPNNFATRLMIRIALKNSFSVLLKANAEDISKRRGKRRFQDPLRLYDKIYKLFDNLENKQYIIIDTSNNNVKESQKKIRQTVLNVLRL